MKISLPEEVKNKEFRENGRRLLLAEISKFDINIFSEGNATVRISASIGDKSSFIEVKIVHITGLPGPIEPWDSTLFTFTMTIDEFKALLRTME